MYKGMEIIGEITWPTGITIPKKPLAEPWFSLPTDSEREADTPGPNIPPPKP